MRTDTHDTTHESLASKSLPSSSTNGDQAQLQISGFGVRVPGGAQKPTHVGRACQERTGACRVVWVVAGAEVWLFFSGRLPRAGRLRRRRVEKVSSWSARRRHSPARVGDRTSRLRESADCSHAMPRATVPMATLDAARQRRRVLRGSRDARPRSSRTAALPPAPTSARSYPQASFSWRPHPLILEASEAAREGVSMAFVKDQWTRAVKLPDGTVERVRNGKR